MTNNQMIMTSPLVTIPLWLRDTYAYVHSEPIQQLNGPLNETILTQEAAITSLASGSGLFLNSADVFTYLNRNISNVCNDTITIVIHSLRDLYWNMRNTLQREEVDHLEVAMKQPLPRFKNIFEYRALESSRDVNPSPLYQLFGTITQFSVIHIPVKHFIMSINDKQPLQVMLSGTNVIIQLDYEAYDFWDPETQSLIESINIPC